MLLEMVTVDLKPHTRRSQHPLYLSTVATHNLYNLLRKGSLSGHTYQPLFDEHSYTLSVTRFTPRPYKLSIAATGFTTLAVEDINLFPLDCESQQSL